MFGLGFCQVALIAGHLLKCSESDPVAVLSSTFPVWEMHVANGVLIIVIILLFQLVYMEAVMENSPSSKFVLKVSASDPDMGANGQISYTLHGPNADKFHLDQRTGMTAPVLGQKMNAFTEQVTMSV